MSKVWTHDVVVKVASEMYEDGTTYSERYSVRAWEVRGWPPIPREDYEVVHSMLTSYLRYLRKLDEYHGRNSPEFVGNPVPGTGKIF